MSGVIEGPCLTRWLGVLLRAGGRSSGRGAGAWPGGAPVSGLGDTCLWEDCTQGPAWAGQASCYPLLPLPATVNGGPFCVRHGWELRMNCHL